MKHFIDVENMKCGGCISSITKALLEWPNVRSVEIDESIGRVQVEGDIDRAVLVERLNALGYPEFGNNSMARRTNSLVSCAIGKLNA